MSIGLAQLVLHWLRHCLAHQSFFFFLNLFLKKPDYYIGARNLTSDELSVFLLWLHRLERSWPWVGSDYIG